MSDSREIVKDYKSIRADYTYDPSIFNAEPDRIRKVKEIISTRLSQVDRTLILLYVDCQSYRKLGKKLGLSHMTCRKEIIRIKKIILEEYERIR